MRRAINPRNITPFKNQILQQQQKTAHGNFSDQKISVKTLLLEADGCKAPKEMHIELKRFIFSLQATALNHRNLLINFTVMVYVTLGGC